MNESLRKGQLTYVKPEGVDKLYNSIKDVKQKNFERNPEKIDANITPEPDSTIVIADRKNHDEIQKPNVYDMSVNDKIQKGSVPKFTFET